jgi:diadenosine tetraphosphatase ApaH/serine/threonine PP2A family protein phosphatase
MIKYFSKNTQGKDYFTGDTPLQKPTKLGNVYYIDIGACFGKDLTLLSTEELIRI